METNLNTTYVTNLSNWSGNDDENEIKKLIESIVKTDSFLKNGNFEDPISKRNIELAAKIVVYTLSRKITIIPFELEIAHQLAVMTIQKIPTAIDLLFLCGSEFDCNSNLNKVLPKDILKTIFMSKYALLHFKTFEACITNERIHSLQMKIQSLQMEIQRLEINDDVSEDETRCRFRCSLF